MSKKQKRSVSSVSVNEVVTETARTTSAPRRFSSVSTEFNPDYTHVKIGLKRIAILASSFVLILIVLTFIIN